MKIKYWTDFSKRKNSTKQPLDTQATEIDVKLKDDCSVVNPVIETSSIPINANYFYIDDFKRYYFLDNTERTSQQLKNMAAEVDVLATYKSQIGSTVANIAYSSTGWNKYLIDSRAAVKITKNIKRGSYDPAIFDDYGVFLLSIASTKSSANGMSASYLCTSAMLDNIANVLMGLDIDNRIIKSIYAPFDAVISCTWLPLKWSVVSGLGAYENVYFGDYDSGVQAYRLTSTKLTDIKQITLTPTYDDFRATQPYTSYSLLIPMYGIVDINASDVRAILQAGTGLSIGWELDVASGDMTVGVYTGASIIGQSINFNIGVNCPIGQTSNNMTGTITSIGGVAGGIVGTALSIAGGNAPGAVVSGIAALTSGANLAMSANARATSIKGGINGRTVVALGGSFVLSEYAMDTEDVDSDAYIARWGRPVGEVHTISSHSGYIQCDNASCSMPGTAIEKDRVNAYLNSGFFYE